MVTAKDDEIDLAPFWTVLVSASSKYVDVYVEEVRQLVVLALPGMGIGAEDMMGPLSVGTCE